MPIKSKKETQKGIGVAMGVAIVTVLTSTPIFLLGATSKLVTKDVHLDISKIGLMFTLYWFFSIIGAYLSRNDRSSFSIKYKISGSLFVTSFALGIISIYPAIGLWLGPALGGAVYGYSQPYTNLLIIKKCSYKIHGFAYGLKQAAIPAATLFCSLSVPVAVSLGWRNIFAIISILSIFYAIVIAKYDNNDVIQITNNSHSKIDMNWHLGMLALAGGLGAMIGNSLGGFLIVTLTSGGFTLSTASLVAAIAATSNIIVRLIAGFITDYTDWSPSLMLKLMFFFGIVGTLLLSIVSPLTYIIGAILAYAGGWGWAGLLHFITAKSYPKHEKQATSISQMGVSIGACVGPLLFGWIFKNSGSTLSWLFLTIAGIFALLSITIAYRLDNRVQENSIHNSFKRGEKVNVE